MHLYGEEKEYYQCLKVNGKLLYLMMMKLKMNGLLYGLQRHYSLEGVDVICKNVNTSDSLLEQIRSNMIENPLLEPFVDQLASTSCPNS